MKDFLDKFSKVGMSGGFDIEGIGGGFKVLSELVKDLFFGVNGGIRHLVIPHFQEIDASVE